jgi:hypothetical protein
VPADAFVIDANAFADRDMGGTPMHEAAAGAADGRFFRRLERLVWRMHRRGMAHLDLRYRRNILVLDDGSPGVVDFQSAVCLDRLPRKLKRFLRRVDLSGVYKHWCHRDPGTLGARRLAILASERTSRSVSEGSSSETASGTVPPPSLATKRVSLWAMDFSRISAPLISVSHVSVCPCPWTTPSPKPGCAEMR